MNNSTIFVITFIVVFAAIFFGYQFFEKLKEDFSNIKNFFNTILVDEAQKRNLQVCPKVRLENIVSVTDYQNKNKYREQNTHWKN